MARRQGGSIDSRRRRPVRQEVGNVIKVKDRAEGSATRKVKYFLGFPVLQGWLEAPVLRTADFRRRSGVSKFPS